MPMRYKRKELIIEPILSQGNLLAANRGGDWCGRTSACNVYNYYKKVSGKTAPADLIVNNQNPNIAPHDLIYQDTNPIKAAALGYNLEEPLTQTVAGWNFDTAGGADRRPLYPKDENRAPVTFDKMLEILEPVFKSLDNNNPVIAYTSISESVTKARHIVVIAGYSREADGSVWLSIVDPAVMGSNEAPNNKSGMLGGDNLKDVKPAKYFEYGCRYRLRALRLFEPNTNSAADDLFCDHCDRPGLYVIINENLETKNSPYSVQEGGGFCIPLDYGGNVPKTQNFYTKPEDLRVTRETLDSAYKHTEKENKGGYFPLGANTTWHGGVHLHAPANTPVIAMCEGEVVAARIEYQPDENESFLGSRNFVLMRHQMTPVLLDQLYSLKIPWTYLMLANDVPLPNASGAGNLLVMRKGDMVKREDPEDGRLNGDAGGLVSVVSLNSEVTTLEGFHIIGPGTKLYADSACSQEVLDLIPGDAVELLKSVSYHKQEPRPTGPTEIWVSRLEDDVFEIHSYKVKQKPGFFYGFHRDANDKATPDASKINTNRLLDLAAGDVLEKLDPADKGTPDPDDSKRLWVKVKLIPVTPAPNVITEYKVTTKWSLRETTSRDNRVMWLAEGDVLEVVQKASAVDGEKHQYDLVKLKSLKGKIAGSYNTTRKDVGAFSSQDVTSAVVKVPLGTLFTVTGLEKLVNRATWVPVKYTTADGDKTGWICPALGGVKANLLDRSQTWCKDFIGKPCYVDIGNYGKPTLAPRPAPPADLTGFIPVSASELALNVVVMRKEKYPDVVPKKGQTATHYWVKPDAANYQDKGKSRDKVLRALYAGKHGKLTYDKSKMQMKLGIPTKVKAALTGQYFYSLYHHLFNKRELQDSDESLKKYLWLPRWPLTHTLSGYNTFTEDEEGNKLLMKLASGDKLEQVNEEVKPGSTKRRCKLLSLSEADLVTSISVTGSVPLWEDVHPVAPVFGLLKGDELKVEEIGGETGTAYSVSIKSLVPGKIDTNYTVNTTTKDLYAAATDDAKSLYRLALGDKLKVLADVRIGPRKFNYVEIVEIVPPKPKEKLKADRLNKRGWVRTATRTDFKDIEEADRSGEGVTGYILLDPKTATAHSEKRTALYAKYINQAAYISYSRDGMSSDGPIDPRILKKFKENKVVNLANDGSAGKGGIFPTIDVGSPLWTSGEYGLFNKGNDIEKRQPRIHFEVFSEQNLLRFHDKVEVSKRWSEVRDEADEKEADEIRKKRNEAAKQRAAADGSAKLKGEYGDYNIDNAALIPVLRKACPSLTQDDFLTGDEVVKFYQTKDAAQTMRRFACKFVAEWGIDLESALKNLRQPGPSSWMSATKAKIQPQLWWDEALAAGVPLPERDVFHYNPFGFVEAYSEEDLRQKEKAAAQAAPATPGVNSSEPGQIKLVLPYNPHDPLLEKYKFTLKATDGSYSKTLSAKDDSQEGDLYLQLIYDQLDRSKTYSLFADYGTGTPWVLIHAKAYEEFQTLEPDEAE